MNLHFCYNTHSNEKDLVESFDQSPKGIKWKRLFALFHKNEIISLCFLFFYSLNSMNLLLRHFGFVDVKKKWVIWCCAHWQLNKELLNLLLIRNQYTYKKIH